MTARTSIAGPSPSFGRIQSQIEEIGAHTPLESRKCDETPEQKRADDAFFQGLQRDQGYAHAPDSLGDGEIKDMCRILGSASSQVGAFTYRECVKKISMDQALEPDFKRTLQEGFRQGFGGQTLSPGPELTKIPQHLIDFKRSYKDQVACGQYFSDQPLVSIMDSKAVFGVMRNSLEMDRDRMRKYQWCMLGFVVGNRKFANRFDRITAQAPLRPSEECILDHEEGRRFGQFYCTTRIGKDCGKSYTPAVCNPGCFSAGFDSGLAECMRKSNSGDKLVMRWLFGIKSSDDRFYGKGLASDYRNMLKHPDGDPKENTSVLVKMPSREDTLISKQLGLPDVVQPF